MIQDGLQFRRPRINGPPLFPEVNRLRAEIAKWPDGTYHGEALLDHDFAGGGPVKVTTSVTVTGSDVVIDFAGSDPQVPGFVNSVATNTYSNIYTALVALFPDLPVNSGYFRPFTINLPGHSVVNCGPLAPVGYSTVCIGSDICETVMKAFEDICPDLVGAADIDICNVRVFGTNSKTGRFFVGSDINATPMSAGGAKGVDGWGGNAAPFCALRLPSLEMFDQQYPYRYIQVEYASDTAAPGEFRGAPTAAKCSTRSVASSTARATSIPWPAIAAVKRAPEISSY